jgi:hypothetical protein
MTVMYIYGLFMGITISDNYKYHQLAMINWIDIAILIS